jgi:hypothetical protein
LLAGGDTTSQSVHKGVEYLLRTQRSDGSWDEELATGTGFPKVFYLNYHLYRLYFPLLALSEYGKITQNEGKAKNAVVQHEARSLLEAALHEAALHEATKHEAAQHEGRAQHAGRAATVRERCNPSDRL